MMNAEASNDWLNGARAKKLLRLYLAWPSRFSATQDTEAQLFLAWLQENYGDLSIVRGIRGEADIQDFLSQNPEIIEAARFLKPADGGVEGSARRERRIRTSTHVFLSIYESRQAPDLIGHTIKGSVLDVTRSGLGVLLPEPISIDTIINMTVAPTGYPIVLYRLTGQVKWVEGGGDLYQAGVHILDVDEAERWRADFESRFDSDLEEI